MHREVSVKIANKLINMSAGTLGAIAGQGGLPGVGSHRARRHIFPIAEEFSSHLFKLPVKFPDLVEVVCLLSFERLSSFIAFSYLLLQVLNVTKRLIQIICELKCHLVPGHPTWF